ncbi:MAG: PAS domain S-box protein [Syntrophales bacterium]|jgi:PAS domain S-box-containing protein
MEGNGARKEIENNGLIIISIAAVLVYWFFDALLSGVVFVRLLIASLIVTYGTFTQYLINSHKAAQSELKKAHNGMEEQVRARTAQLLTANEELERSEILFHTLAQVSPVGIFRIDAQGDLIYVNDRWCEIAGMPMEMAVGKNWAEAIRSEERESIVKKWYGSVQGNRPFNLEYQFDRPDGSSTWVLSQATAEFNDAGEISGYVGTIRDIHHGYNGAKAGRRRAYAPCHGH